MGRVLKWDADAWADYVDWQVIDKQMVKRIDKLIAATLRAPFEGIGKPEPLKGDLAGFWSRRIDREHRLVYTCDDDAVYVIACRNHYS